MSTPSTSGTQADREQARLGALRRYAILDTAAEEKFDELVRTAARETGYPTALLTFMDAQRCWFKAATGLLPRDAGIRELPRTETFCNHALNSSGTLIVQDAREDARFASLSYVARSGGYRSYMGAQLITPDGHSIGTLCVLSPKPHEPTAEQRTTLRRLADQAARLLEERRRDLVPAASIAVSPPSAAIAPVERDLTLVVDDEDLIRGVTAAMLKRLGHEVRLAADGEQALACVAAEGGRLRLVVTDIHMPVMNGLVLVRMLRDLPNPPAIVAMSGKFTTEILAELRTAGVTTIIMKPFGMVDLARAVEEVRAAAR